MDEDKKNNVIELFKKASEPKPALRIEPTISVIGDKNMIGNNNTFIHTEQIIRRPRVVVVKTGDGVVTAEQKARLKQLVIDWMTARNAVLEKPLTFGGAWSAVNKKAGVNSYNEIPTEKFPAVEKWLIRQIGIVNAAPAASAKSTGWRASRIKGIQSRCTELGIQDARKTYMLKAFGKDSLTLISDVDIEKVYRWAIGKH